MSPFYENIFLLLGTIIGAGIFSLPIALKQSGWIFFLLTIIGLEYLLAKVNSFYREIVDSVSDKHQLPGYVRLVLGPQMSRIAALLLLSSIFGALLAYLIIGGTFTANAIGSSPRAGSFVFFLFIFLITALAGKRIEQFDVFFTIVKIILLLFIILTSIGPLTLFTARFIPVFGNNPLGAYGSILFALVGVSIVPELKKNKHIHASIYIAEFIVCACYILFAIVLYPYLTDGSYMFKSMFFDITGVFTILSPYLMLSLIGNDLLVEDLHLSKSKAYFIILLVPLMLFFIGLTSFMKVISLTGGVFIGSIVLIISMMYRKKFPQKHTVFIAIIQWIFLIGVLLEIWQFFQP